mmetsp:Transcript_22624/g.59091  ORF Transcript_22624/g.59091 Transcript_22624/m.59091 type:complete len:423 (-) Transcript_22624:39-1307(-)
MLEVCVPLADLKTGGPRGGNKADLLSKVLTEETVTTVDEDGCAAIVVDFSAAVVKACAGLKKRRSKRKGNKAAVCTFGDIADAALNLVFERKRRCGAQKVYIATDPYAATDEKRSVKRWAWEARAKGALRAREYVNLNGDTEVVGGKGKVMDVLRMGSNKQQLQNLVYSVLDKRLEREGLRDGESVFWVAPAPSDGDGHNAWHGDWAGQVRKECIKRLQSTADEADFKFSLCIEHHKSKKESSGHVVVWAEDTDIIADVISRGWEGAQTEGEADILIMRDRRGGTLYNSVQKCAKELQETYPVLGRTLLTGLQALHVLSGCDYTSFCRRLTLSTSAKMETKPCQHWGHSEPSQSLPSLTPRRTLWTVECVPHPPEHRVWPSGPHSAGNGSTPPRRPTFQHIPPRMGPPHTLYTTFRARDLPR